MLSNIKIATYNNKLNRFNLISAKSILIIYTEV